MLRVEIEIFVLRNPLENPLIGLLERMIDQVSIVPYL